MVNLVQLGTLRSDPACDACRAAGTCETTVDGGCSMGGVLANGMGGYRSPAMGYFGAGGNGTGDGSGQCTALGIFWQGGGGGIPYSVDGSAMSTNANTLRANRRVQF